MKKLLFTLCFLYFTLQISAQVKLVLPENYYEGYYMQNFSKECYAFDFTPTENLLDSMDVYNDYVELKVIPYTLYTNLLRYDDEGLFLPYDNTEGENYRIKMRSDPEYNSGSRFKYAGVLDTIDILRENPSRNPAIICGNKKKRMIPFEYFRFLTIDSNRITNDDFEEDLITIFVEVKENDIINPELRRRIICPHEIDRELIKELNQKLIDIGYLKDEYRRVYAPEIRTAISRLQKNRNLLEGFLDLRTLKELNVKPRFYVNKLISSGGIIVSNN